MKLESFKFQDGKVFWLPEYPEEVPIQGSSLGLWKQYDMAVAQSLALALEVVPEDVEEIKDKIWWGIEDMISENNMNDKVYSAECEMETHYEEIVRGQWVSSSKGIFELVSRSKQPDEVRRFAHIKPKEEIFPAANSHDMKDEDL